MPVENKEVGESKPKRQLTEVQRLAFLKGREKRLANIEKKRQEKLEEETAMRTQTDIPPSPVKVKKERKPRTKKVVEESPPPPPPPVPSQDPNPPSKAPQVEQDIAKSEATDDKAEGILPPVAPMPAVSIFTDEDYERFSVEVLKRLKTDPSFIAATSPAPTPKPPRLRRQTNRTKERSPSPTYTPPLTPPPVRQMTWM